MSISRECQPERWNSDAGLARGTTEEVKALNAYISILQGKIHQYHMQLMATGKPITAEVLKNKVAGKSERVRSLIKILRTITKKLKPC